MDTTGSQRITVRGGHLFRLAAAFVIGFVSLSLEIGYTRIISYKLFYYYTYFVIGLALLGLGASSAVVSLSNRVRHVELPALLRKVAPIAGVTGVVTYFIVARLPINTNVIWTGSKFEALGQLARLFVLALSVTAVFFALGVALSSLVVVEAHHVRSLYFWDLTGAALGCLLAVPLQRTVGPPAMILGAVALFSLLGIVAAFLQGRGHKLAVGLALLVVVGAFVAGSVEIRTDDSKTHLDGVVASEWGPVFRVDVVDQGKVQVLLHDGLWGSGIWKYDGTPATTARFAGDDRQIPFAALGTAPDNLLIIGAAGGNEIQAALTYGVGHIDAVELNPVTVSLLRGRFAEYSGNIANNPKVDYINGDGRTYLARSNKQYDMIWFVAPDSYAASNAASSGAFVLSESYLYTKEMIRESYDHLSDEGMIIAQFGDTDFAITPNRTARYLVTARAALDSSVDDFGQHVALLVRDQDFDISRASTILLTRPPLTADAVDRVKEIALTIDGERVMYLPGETLGAGITPQIITADQQQLDALVDNYPYDISVVTDDRPFFWHFSGFPDVISHLQRDYQGSEIAIGERLVLLLCLIGAVIAGLLLWPPFAITRRRGAPSVRGRSRLFLYFAAIGVGFMTVEITMIQRFALLLGYPTLSLSVSLFTLLIATAVGARFSKALVAAKRWGLVAATIALCVISVVYLSISQPLTDTALAWAQWARIMLVAVLMFPVGLVLGVFLPAGVERATAAAATAETDEGRLIAWCWAVNGFFSVLGSSIATISTMEIGFNRTVVVGLVCYVGAALAMSAGRTATIGQPTS